MSNNWQIDEFFWQFWIKMENIEQEQKISKWNSLLQAKTSYKGDNTVGSMKERKAENHQKAIYSQQSA